MSRRHLVVGSLLTWLFAVMALRFLPMPTSSIWRYFSVDFLVFLILWVLCFHLLFRSAARGIGGLTELPLPIYHWNRLRYVIPVLSGLLLLLVLFLQVPVYTVLGTGFFGGREVWFWIKKKERVVELVYTGARERRD